MSRGRFPFKPLARYPHLKKYDIEVWERFIAELPGYLDSVDYDVCLGKGRQFSPNVPENIARNGRVLTQRKIDVIGYCKDDIFLIEVKRKVDARGLGQILNYRTLFLREFIPSGSVHMVVIGGELEPDISETYTEHGVIYFVV